MIAVAERPIPATPPLAQATPGPARQLAAGLLRQVSASWRGDTSVAVFPLRLSAYWRPAMPPAPAPAPEIVSPHGAGGRGILWYETGQEVLGYVPGLPGGFRVPMQAVLRLAHCAA